MWNSRISLVKMLYFANRFVPICNIAFTLYSFVLAKQSGPEICVNEFISIGALMTFEFQIAFAVLCVRAYAVWRSRRILIVILTTFIVSVSAWGYILGKYMSGVKALDPEVEATGCIFLLILETNDMRKALILLLILDTVVLMMLLLKSWQTFRSNTHNPSLLNVMAKDGIGYFSCVIALSLANFFVLRSAEPIVRDMFILPQAAFQDALSVRIILHLHAVDKKEALYSSATPSLSTFRAPAIEILSGQHAVQSSAAPIE